MRIAKDILLYEGGTGAPLNTAGGEFSGLSLFAFWKDSDRLMAKCLFKNEMIGEDSGVYLGSLHPGQWTAAVKFTEYEGDSSPTIHMVDDEPFAVWTRGPGLQKAPSFLKKEVLTAKVGLSDEMSVGGFSVDLDNTSGMFTESESKYLLYFREEKSIVLFLGFGGEFVRMMTAQIDETDAEHSLNAPVYTVQTVNKYRDLLGLPLTKTYGMTYKSSGRTTIINAFKVSAAIKPFDTVEVQVEAPAPARWYPTSPRLENVNPGSGLQFSQIYGSTETVFYVRITNTSAAPIQPVFDVTACPVLEDVVLLASGSLTVSSGEKTSTNFIEFLQAADPESLQVRLVNASGNVPALPIWWKGSTIGWAVHSVFQTTDMGAEISLFSPAANMTGIQVVCSNTASRSRTYYYEVYGRPYGSMIGDYWEAKDVLYDLVKTATHKETMLASREGSIAEGQDSTDFIIDFEEDIDTTTVRVEDLGNRETVASIVELTKRQAVISVTRVGDTNHEINFSFEVWGNYAGRLDFFSPMYLRITNPPALQFNAPLVFDNEPIIDAAGKVRQVCFTDDGSPYRFFFGARNDWRMVPLRLGAPVHTFKVRNMAKIRKSLKTPDLIDRVEVKGAVTPIFVMETREECLHTQKDKVRCPNFKGSLVMTINFSYMVKPDTIHLRKVWTDDGDLWITDRQPTYCVVKLDNDTFLNLGDSEATFEVWGEPFAGVKYQELYVVKTNANAVGKYKFNEAVVENEMIDNEALGLQVAGSVISESAAGREKISVEGTPHLGLEPCDTVEIVDGFLNVVGYRLIKSIDFNFDATGKAPEIRATYELQNPELFEGGD